MTRAGSSFRPSVATTLPFALEEYHTRRQRVRDEMERRGIDTLYITSPANLFYLTGYDAIWYPNRLPVGAVIHRDQSEILVIDWIRHEGYVTHRVLCDEILFVDYADAPATVASIFVRRGWTGRTVGIEWYSTTPSAPIMRAMADLLGVAGATVVSGDWVCDQARLYKSAEELKRVRQAAAIADRAMLQLQSELQPGMTELEVSARLVHLLAQSGSEIAATPPLVNSGPGAWTDIHGFPSHRRLLPGDIVCVDCCGVVDRYHANLGRTFVLGTINERARGMIRAAAGSLGELQRLGRPGDDPKAAAAAADRYVRERLDAGNIWWIGGYSLGIGFPPGWVGHTYLANDGVEKCRLDPGYVSNFENVLIDARDGFEAGCIDTIVMTDDGLELLSAVPRDLLLAG